MDNKFKQDLLVLCSCNDGWANVLKKVADMEEEVSLDRIAKNNQEAARYHSKLRYLLLELSELYSKGESNAQN